MFRRQSRSAPDGFVPAGPDEPGAVTVGVEVEHLRACLLFAVYPPWRT